MSTRTKPLSQTIFPWLKNNLGPRCLAPLSGQDWKALQAAVHLADLWGNSDDRRAAAMAFRLAVEQMQPSTRQLAYHAIAHPLDWSHRAELWAQAGLEELITIRICAYGPGGKGDATVWPK
jgi:hypothetical protein